MSEREFETYLSLLCRLLRLDPTQREAISRELRDHLEERLADLKSRGVERDEAVRLALDEFGDAAGLAAEFSSIARNVRRRWLMRMTLGSTIAVAAAAMAAMALWPEGRQPIPSPPAAVAQETGQPTPESQPAPASGADPQAAASDKKAPPLGRRIDAGFVETPLNDALEFLRDATGAEFYVNEKRLIAASIPLDSPVTLELKDARAEMLLELVLKQASDQLTYVVREGIVMISTLDDLYGAGEVRVYNVRDLLKLPLAAGPAPYGAGGYDAAGGDIYGVGMAPGMPGAPTSLEDRAAMLAQVITAAVGQQYWSQERDYGTIASYDGLLVVNHNARIHQQVERLLEMLRSAAARQKPAADAAAVSPAGDVERNDAAAREKLARRIAADFVETPLADVLEFLGDALDLEIYPNWKAIEAAQTAKNTPVTLNLAKVRGAMALELALNQTGDQLAYVIRDGVLIVSTVDDLDGAAMLRVYNCRDLLSQTVSGDSGRYGASSAYRDASMMMGSPGGNPYGMAAGPGMGPPGALGGPGRAAPPVSSPAAERIVNILTSSIAPSSWQSAGGTGTIAEFNGLIVVNHNARVHAQVELVLKMVRQAAAAGDKPAVIEPKESQ